MVPELELQLTSGKTPRILVIGDVMVDRHVHCEVLGLSPEDDLTPKIRVICEDFSLGGAGNVAVNLRKLGADVWLAGLVGADEASGWMDDYFSAHLIMPLMKCDRTRPTTVKTRYLTPRGRHIVRVDHEKTHECPEFADWVKHFGLTDLDAIVVSDYAKGAISGLILDILRNKFKCPIIVDPKRPLEQYGRIFAATPNQIEFEQYVNADELCSYQTDWIVVTRGNAGCSLIDKKGLTSATFDVRPREVGDPTGCGDSFVAAFTCAIVRGLPIETACRVANAAGAVKFDHRGVHAVSVQEIVDEMRRSDEGSNPIAGAAGR